MHRTCLIGLDPPEHEVIAERLGTPVLRHESLPRIVVRDGQLRVEPVAGGTFVPVSKVVFHGIFEHDHELLSALALWGGPCLPNARAMMDCRLKLPCLVRALGYTSFAGPPRGFASSGARFTTSIERVVKWGNWHCGENKARFVDEWIGDEATIVEPFLSGRATRIVLIGKRSWQIDLAGDDWLKSIHHDEARLVEVDPDLLADTRRVAAGFGLEIAANDYIVTDDGVPHLLEVNHIPNVTRFPEIREAYLDFVVNWLEQG